MSLIMLLDDNEKYLDSLAVLVQAHGFDSVSFTSPAVAIDYLDETLPFAYIVDMRIPSDLEGSERLFKEVQKRGPTDHFYFNTGNFSPHDSGVIERTGVRYLTKDESVLEALERLASDSLAFQG